MADGSNRNRPCLCGSGKKTKMCCGSSAVRFQPIASGDNRPRIQGDLMLVMLSTRGSISLETHLCLQVNTDGIKNTTLALPRKPIVEARNELWNRLRTFREDPTAPVALGDAFVLWIDDDAWWTANTWKYMIEILRALPQVDLLGGFFCARVPFSHPVAYRSTTDCESFPRPGIDCEPGEVVEVKRIGFYFVMHRLSLIDKLKSETPFTPQGDVLGEDVAFCDALVAAGGHIGCATGISIAHVDAATGLAFAVGSAPMKANGLRLGQNTTVAQNAEGVLVATEIRDYGIALTDDQPADVANMKARNEELLEAAATG
jgi:hypothetical protein